MDRRVRAAIAFMNENLHRKLPLNAIARATQLSAAHLRRLFKSETGVPPVQYLRALRMQRAKELVETAPLSVKEIAAKVGMQDVSHFVRNFEEAVGLPPTRHRARYHGEDVESRSISSALREMAKE